MNGGNCHLRSLGIHFYGRSLTNARTAAWRHQGGQDNIRTYNRGTETATRLGKQHMEGTVEWCWDTCQQQRLESNKIKQNQTKLRPYNLSAAFSALLLNSQPLVASFLAHFTRSSSYSVGITQSVSAHAPIARYQTT